MAEQDECHGEEEVPCGGERPDGKQAGWAVKPASGQGSKNTHTRMHTSMHARTHTCIHMHAHGYRRVPTPPDVTQQLASLTADFNQPVTPPLCVDDNILEKVKKITYQEAANISRKKLNTI